VESRRSPLGIAYLLSQYPAVNHVFMLREVCLLRRLGFDIHVASISNADRDPGFMTATEQAEARATYYVKSTGLLRLAWAHIHTLVSRPGGYIRGLAWALRGGAQHRPRTLYGLFYFTEAVAIGYWMGRQGLIHLHTHYASTVGFLVARIFPVTLSITFHGSAEFLNPAGFRLAEKVRASLFCCAISQYGLGQLMYACGYPEWSKLELTSLGVDPDRFRPRPFRPDRSPFQVICVGQLAPVKGLHLLIAAIAALVREGRNIRLRFAGDGSERSALRQDVENRGLSGRVSFAGNVNQDELLEMYRETDVLAMSSFAEGLPVVLMEAMAMEIPCVAPWVNGIPEIVTHETDGLLVPPADAEALSRAIARLMDETELRRALGQKARLKILAKFDLRRNTEHLADIFRRRLDPKSLQDQRPGVVKSGRAEPGEQE
jgi:colanic acid/amylovoran biosynthesis glycosyltransferase